MAVLTCVDWCGLLCLLPNPPPGPSHPRALWTAYAFVKRVCRQLPTVLCVRVALWSVHVRILPQDSNVLEGTELRHPPPPQPP